MAAIHRPAEASPHENSTLPSLPPPYKAKSTIAEPSPRCGCRCRAHGRAAGLFSTGSRPQLTTFPPNRGRPRPSSSSSGCRTSIAAVELRLQSLQGEFPRCPTMLARLLTAPLCPAVPAELRQSLHAVSEHAVLAATVKAYMIYL
uniref:Uncharacterized protein n=1 Tax=Arundo donax TaxID=35708 RepID=A0A0A9D911_ARUDO